VKRWRDRKEGKLRVERGEETEPDDSGIKQNTKEGTSEVKRTDGQQDSDSL
jgi:hypothetical protein